MSDQFPPNIIDVAACPDESPQGPGILPMIFGAIAGAIVLSVVVVLTYGFSLPLLICAYFLGSFIGGVIVASIVLTEQTPFEGAILFGHGSGEVEEVARK